MYNQVKQNSDTLENNNNRLLSQEELCDFLTTKLRKFNNVHINTRKIENAHGICYGIDVKNYTLNQIGNGIFHSLCLRTVSHCSRIINIKLVFNDNEEQNHDMKVNADSIIQIYRELANTKKPNGEINKTLENIYINEFEDERQNKHLAVIGESTKGASLIYIYLRTMEFVKIINDKYNNNINIYEDDDNDDNNNTNELTIDEIDNKIKILEKKIKALQDLRQIQKQSLTLPNNDIKNISSTLDDEIIHHPTQINPINSPKQPVNKKFTIKLGNKIMKKTTNNDTSKISIDDNKNTNDIPQ